MLIVINNDEIRVIIVRNYLYNFTLSYYELTAALAGFSVDGIVYSQFRWHAMRIASRTDRDLIFRARPIHPQRICVHCLLSTCTRNVTGDHSFSGAFPNHLSTSVAHPPDLIKTATAPRAPTVRTEPPYNERTLRNML